MAAAASVSGQTVQWGPYSGSLSVGTGLEWNSNPTYSSRNQLADTFWTTSATWSSKYEFTKDSSLNFDIGTDYRDAFNHNELDYSNLSVSLRPNLKLEGLVRVTERLYINLQEQLEFRVDPVDSVGVDSQGNVVSEAIFFERSQNTASAMLQWDATTFDTFTVGLTRLDTNSFTDAYANSEVTSYILSTGWNHQWNKRWSTSVGASRDWNDYWNNIQNDSTGYGLNVGAVWTASDTLTVTGGFGWNWRNFDATGTNGDSSDLSGSSWRVEFEHSPTEVISYSFGYSQSQNLGRLANTQEVRALRWAGNYTGFNRFTITGRAGYEWLDDSGGFLADQAERFYVSTGAKMQIGPDLTAQFDVGYVRKWAEREGRDYEQFHTGVSLTYTF